MASFSMSALAAVQSSVRWRDGRWWIWNRNIKTRTWACSNSTTVSCFADDAIIYLCSCITPRTTIRGFARTAPTSWEPTDATLSQWVVTVRCSNCYSPFPDCCSELSETVSKCQPVFCLFWQFVEGSFEKYLERLEDPKVSCSLLCWTPEGRCNGVLCLQSWLTDVTLFHGVFSGDSGSGGDQGSVSAVQVRNTQVLALLPVFMLSYLLALLSVYAKLAVFPLCVGAASWSIVIQGNLRLWSLRTTLLTRWSSLTFPVSWLNRDSQYWRRVFCIAQVTLCCSINGHYDIVYPKSYPVSAALCQCEYCSLIGGFF